MNLAVSPATREATNPIIKLAVLAVGGQGGGVLSGWITKLAETNGYHVQATSVAGVAQRTGATIYYVEMKRIDPARPDALPVFSLMPGQGDVDIVVASEMAEAGRAMMRDFVSQDRTVLIASSHRELSVAEKAALGDGRAEGGAIAAIARKRAREFVCFDMGAIAARHGTVVSASLFGALGGSGALPFPLSAFRAVVEQSGRGVKQSLAAFDEAAALAADPEAAAAAEQLPDTPPPADLVGPPALLEAYKRLQARIDTLPAPVRDLAGRGLVKVVDFQDIAYGSSYLDRLEALIAEDRESEQYVFTSEAAKYIANAMAYDDVIRVADLKTRATRARRVRSEIGIGDDQALNLTEYFHPRGEEVCGLFPAGIGRWFHDRPKAMKRLDRLVNRGRRMRTDRTLPFFLLWLVAGLRPLRRSLFRHAQETTHLENWLTLARVTRDADYRLGVEVLKCRRLIKGYSDTHARGNSKFDRVLSGLDLVKGRDDAADWIRRLREAALKDEKGDALDGALATLRTL
ncbi:MAG: indolepyruvate oxidoreductase subunit beta family protein [Pseudomonadota bacterium]